ncbi:MAG: M14 family zinc carboxypeptidase [Bacteriovoracaceae bacterium]
MIFTRLAFVGALLTVSASSWSHDQPELEIFETPRTLITEVKFADYKVGMVKLQALNLDIAGIDIKNSSADVVINEEELRMLEEAGFDVEVRMSTSLMRSVDSEYKNPAEIEAILKDFNARFPDLTEFKEVGKSLQGRSIFALKISDNAKIHEASEPVILFNGMHHAREVMGPEVALDIIETLLENHGKDPKITHWVDSNEIWVMPMFNVDGNNIVWTKNNMWRKNARGNYGVDINRNYPYAWGSCNGSSGSQGAQDYRGPSPASEPETQVMMNLVKEIRPVFDISYHSYSELVIYPYGCKGKHVPSADVVEKIGKAMGSLLGYKPGTSWETLYSTDGGDIDWMYGEYQVIPYVIEVSSSSDGFQPSYSLRQPTVELNRKAWQHLLDRLDGSGIRGQVSKNDKAVKEFSVKVQKVVGTTATDYMNYKGNSDGSFHLVLNEGVYRLTISGPGVQTTTQDTVVNKVRVQVDFKL